MDQLKVELQESMGSDRSIAEAAWTSSIDYQKKKARTDEDVKRVLNMLADLKHSVPFESVVFRFWIKMPISTDRQHMTHRIASHSGMSGRYRTMPSEFQNVPKDVEDILNLAYVSDDNPSKAVRNIIGEYNQYCQDANAWYREIVEEFKEFQNQEIISNKQFKRVREFFRNVLPQGNMTERITVMNLRSFANYQFLRNSEHAQEEIEYIAKGMLAEVEKKNVCPIAIECLKRNGWVL
jgi:flavin-dependent thymidylate synthase